MEWVLDENPAPRSRIELRVGQVWSFANGLNVLHEVVGFADNDVIYVSWLPGKTGGTEESIHRGGFVHLDESNFCHGAGGGQRMPVEGFVHPRGGVAKLVFLSHERHHSAGITWCTVMGSRQRHPCCPRTASASPLWTKLQQMAVRATAVFTDGSKASFRDVAGYYEGSETSKSSSGVALYIEDANDFVGIHITGQPAMTNSFMTEMLALGLGVRLAQSDNLTVYSDCAAALGSLRLRQAKKI